MTQMTVAFCADDFATPGFSLLDDIVVLDCSRETRPAGARIEFVCGAEQMIAAGNAVINSVVVIVGVCAPESLFRSLLASNFVLQRRQLFFPFIVCFFDVDRRGRNLTVLAKRAVGASLAGDAKSKHAQNQQSELWSKFACLIN